MVKYIILLISVMTSNHVYAQNTMMDILEHNSAGPAQYTSPEEIAEYTRLAEEGNIQAMGYLGDMYYYGEETVPKDCEKAMKYYKMGAGHGDSTTMLDLGNRYLFGQCVAQDFQKAEYYFLEAGKKGVSPAMMMLGVMNETGMGKPADYDKALEWYFKTANNPVEVYYGEGKRAYSGFLILPWLTERARAFGATDSFKKYQTIDTLKTFLAFKAAAEKGDKYAMMALASAYQSGVCTPQDTAKGKYWLLKSANAGNERAMYELGVMYSPRGDNFDGPRDYVTSGKWFLKAAEHGYIDGMTSIAIIYYHGRGIPQDYKKAMEWFLKAAAKGNALAMYDLGLMFVNGEGVPADPKKGFEWFSKAAAQD